MKKETKTNIAKSFKISLNTVLNYEKVEEDLVPFLDLVVFIKENKITRKDVASLKIMLCKENDENERKRNVMMFSIMKFKNEKEELFLTAYDAINNNINKEELSNYIILKK